MTNGFVSSLTSVTFRLKVRSFTYSFSSRRSELVYSASLEGISSYLYISLGVVAVTLSPNFLALYAASESFWRPFTARLWIWMLFLSITFYCISISGCLDASLPCSILLSLLKLTGFFPGLYCLMVPAVAALSWPSVLKPLMSWFLLKGSSRMIGFPWGMRFGLLLAYYVRSPLLSLWTTGDDC